MHRDIKEEGRSKNRVGWAPTTSVQILSLLMFSLPSGIHSAVHMALVDFIIALTQNLTRSNLREKGLMVRSIITGKVCLVAEVRGSRERSGLALSLLSRVLFYPGLHPKEWFPSHSQCIFPFPFNLPGPHRHAERNNS